MGKGVMIFQREKIKTKDILKKLAWKHEQCLGLIFSIILHSLVFFIFFAFSIYKAKTPLKTFYIQFTEIEDRAIHAPHKPYRKIDESRKYRVMKKDILQTQRIKEIIEDTPKEITKQIKKEEFLKEEVHKDLIKTEAIEGKNVVNVANIPEGKSQMDKAFSQDVKSKGRGLPSGISAENREIINSGKPQVVNTEVGSANGPTFLHRELPVYPLIARKLGKEGKVVLRLFIDEKGRLLDIEVIEGADYGFTEAAIEAVKKSKFLPARINGVNVASKAILTVRFVLKKEE